MRHDFLDRFSRIDSPVHRLPACLKLAGAVVLLGSALAVRTDSAAWFAALAAILVMLVAASRIPWTFIVQRLLQLEIFVIGVSLLALFQPGGLQLFALLVIRATVCLAVLVLFCNTTRFSDLLLILRALRLPGMLVTTLSLMYRYVFVLIDEKERMERARASRTFAARRTWIWQHGASLIAQLFLRSVTRAERIYAAMCARGWKA